MDTEQNRSAEQCLYASTVLVFFISPLIPPRFSCSQRCISCWKPTGARACCSVEISSYIRRMPVYPVAPSGCLGQRQRDLRPLFPSLSIFLVGFDARPRFVPSISYLLSLSLSPRNGTSLPSCTIATVTGERRSFLSRLYRWSFPRAGNLVVSTARSFN